MKTRLHFLEMIFFIRVAEQSLWCTNAIPSKRKHLTSGEGDLG